MPLTRNLPGPLLAEWDWQRHAACRGMDTAVFFAADGERGAIRTERETVAKRVCAGCPVIEPCRTHALQAGEVYGVWGGLTEFERETLLREEAS